MVYFALAMVFSVPSGNRSDVIADCDQVQSTRTWVNHLDWKTTTFGKPIFVHSSSMQASEVYTWVGIRHKLRTRLFGQMQDIP